MKETEFNIGGKHLKGYLLSIAVSKMKEKKQGAWEYCAIYLTATSEIIAHTIRYEKGVEKESLIQTVTDFYELNNISLVPMLDAKQTKSLIDEYFLLKQPMPTGIPGW